jgi:hypothetical protein
MPELGQFGMPLTSFRCAPVPRCVTALLLALLLGAAQYRRDLPPDDQLGSCTARPGLPPADIAQLAGYRSAYFRP